MMQSRPSQTRSRDTKPAAVRAPIFTFKPRLEPFLEETFHAVARLPD